MEIKTHRDHFVFDFDLSALHQRIQAFRKLTIPDPEIAEKYELKDTRDWKIDKRRKSLAANQEWEKYFTQCLYRPFDWRAYYHHEDVVELPRNEIMKHILTSKNLAFGIGRQGNAVEDIQWSLISVSNFPVDTNLFRRGGINIFPLYLYPDITNPQNSFFVRSEVEINISQNFLNTIQEKLGYIPTPEAIFY
jgi:predicted helicase